MKLIKVSWENFKDYLLSDQTVEKYPNKSRENLIAREILFKELWKYPDFKNDWTPFFNGDYFSISHKKWLVVVWVSDSPIWVDVEYIKERNKFLLARNKDEEYEMLWWKNWKNFYILWTAKESILKLHTKWLDFFGDIILLEVKDSELVFAFDKVKNIVVKYQIQENIIISFAVFDKNS